MTERCEHCRGRGRVTVQSRCYEYPTFNATCTSCEGTGVHRNAFRPKRYGLDMQGERELNRTEREVRRRAEHDFNETFIYGGPVGAGPFTDEFGIGQERVAEIRLENANEMLTQAVIEAFSTGYENDDWRAMRRRQFDRALAERQRALGVLEDIRNGLIEEAA